jgi:hypothetical protein
MIDKEFVIQSCRIKRLDLWKPKKGCPGVTAYDFNNKVSGVFPCVIDAKTWAEAKQQLLAYYAA